MCVSKLVWMRLFVVICHYFAKWLLINMITYICRRYRPNSFFCIDFFFILAFVLKTFQKRINVIVFDKVATTGFNFNIKYFSNIFSLNRLKMLTFNFLKFQWAIQSQMVEIHMTQRLKLFRCSRIRQKHLRQKKAAIFTRFN